VRTLLLLPRTAALFVGVSTVAVPPVSAGEGLLPPFAWRVWASEFNLDFAAVLLAAAVLLIVAIVVVRLAIRRRARPLEPDRVTSAPLDEFALAHLVEDSRRFLNLWQERVERLGELHSRLTTMTQEIDQLRAQVTQLDELRGENLRLGEEVGALVLERDDLRLVLGRIGELLQRASEGPPGAGGGAAPEIRP
jgi:hypothetical protein